MGNKQNQLINCGFDERTVQQEVHTTREEAIQRNRRQQNSVLDRNTKLFANVQNPHTPKQFDSKPQSATSYSHSTSRLGQMKFSEVPSHENLTKVSITPQPGYNKIPGCNAYEKQYSKCLDEIIESRYHTSMHFPENQMIVLLESLVYSLAYMTKKGLYHHDYYPTNIFYDNGNFMIRNPKVLEHSSFAITQQQKRFSFLSPQLILEVLEDTKEEDVSEDIKEKADVFAIGMIMLQFCTLQPSSECYDPETYSLVDSVIQQRINKCASIYNPLISDCISLMLQYQVSKRIPPLELAYVVHSKVSEIRAIEIQNQMSKIINQNSRLSMSGKIPQQRISGPLPPNVPPHLINAPHMQVMESKSGMIPAPSNPYQQMVRTPTISENQYLQNSQNINSPRGVNKLRPFEQIQEEQNQNEESPDKAFKGINQAKSLQVDHKEQMLANKLPQREAYQMQGYQNKEASEQNLDERIRRILEKSKKYQ